METKRAVVTCLRCGQVKERDQFPMVPSGVRISRVCKACSTRKQRRRRTHADVVRKTPVVGCIRCLQYKPRDQFPPPKRRISPVCLACREVERLARRERKKAQKERRRTKPIGGVMCRRCPQCREWKELAEHFHLSKLKSGIDVYSGWCKVCQTARTTKRYRKRREDPELVARDRAKATARTRRWRQRHPEAARAASAEYKKKVYADPDRHALMVQNQRIAYRLRKERKGLPFSEHRQRKSSLGAYSLRGGGRYDVEPLREWLEEVIAREVPGAYITGADIETLASELGTLSRVIYRIRHAEYPQVSQRLASELLVRYGRPITINGTKIERRLKAWAAELPGNGARLLAYMDRAERVAHLAGATVTSIEDLWPDAN